MNNSGTGIGGLLLVAFIVLKLTGVIDWSWWWVVSPIWLPIVIALFLFGGYISFKGVLHLFKGKK